VTVLVSPGAVLGNPLVTNTTTTSVTLANVPSGEYYINTNYLCGPDIIVSPQPKGIRLNQCDGDDQPALCHQQLGRAISLPKRGDLFTTHVYVVQQPICSTVTPGTVTNSPGYFQGVGKIRFVKVPDGQMDPLTHVLTTPITNQYTIFPFKSDHWKVGTSYLPAHGDPAGHCFKCCGSGQWAGL